MQYFVIVQPTIHAAPHSLDVVFVPTEKATDRRSCVPFEAPFQKGNFIGCESRPRPDSVPVVVQTTARRVKAKLLNNIEPQVVLRLQIKKLSPSMAVPAGRRTTAPTPVAQNVLVPFAIFRN